MTTKQYAIETDYLYANEQEWHMGTWAAMGTYREMQAEMRYIKANYAEETWRKVGDTWGYKNAYVTRTFRIIDITNHP